MCLTTFDRDLKIADKDIVCYKKGYIKPDDTFEPYYQDYYRYKKGELQPHVPIVFSGVEGEFIVSEGYHSYIAKPTYGTIRNFIIPKGTKYCIGIGGDMVAENLIYIGDDKDLKSYTTKTKIEVFKSKFRNLWQRLNS